MTVPGTFKNRPPVPRRIRNTQHITDRLVAGGAIAAEHWQVGECDIFVAREPVGTGDNPYRWHLSISHATRYPTWDEIKTARYGIATVADAPMMAQLLPRINEDRTWLDLHENCFHLYEVATDLDPGRI